MKSALQPPHLARKPVSSFDVPRPNVSISDGDRKRESLVPVGVGASLFCSTPLPPPSHLKRREDPAPGIPTTPSIVAVVDKKSTDESKESTSLETREKDGGGGGGGGGEGKTSAPPGSKRALAISGSRLDPEIERVTTHFSHFSKGVDHDTGTRKRIQLVPPKTISTTTTVSPPSSSSSPLPTRVSSTPSLASYSRPSLSAVSVATSPSTSFSVRKRRYAFGVTAKEEEKKEEDEKVEEEIIPHEVYAVPEEKRATEEELPFLRPPVEDPNDFFVQGSKTDSQDLLFTLTETEVFNARRSTDRYPLGKSIWMFGVTLPPLPVSSSSSSSSDGKESRSKETTRTLSSSSSRGHSIALRVIFKPWFLIQAPEWWGERELKIFQRRLCFEYQRKPDEDAKPVPWKKEVERCAFEEDNIELAGYHFEIPTRAIRVTCKSLSAFSHYVNVFKDPIRPLSNDDTPVTFKTFNTQVPMRVLCMAAAGVRMYGNIRIPRSKLRPIGFKKEATTTKSGDPESEEPGGWSRSKDSRASREAKSWNDDDDDEEEEEEEGNEAKSKKKKHDDVPWTTCQGEWEVDWTDLQSDSDPRIAPLLKVSFDIEVVRGRKGATGFPDAQRQGDMITHISNYFYYHGERLPERTVIMCLGENVPIGPLDGHPNGIQTLCYHTERDLLQAWKQMVCDRCDADEWVTYNGINFDIKYMCDRATLHGLHEFYALSKFRDYSCTIEEKESFSKQRGDRKMYEMKLPGRNHFDVCQVVTREFPTLELYGLKYVQPILMKEFLKNASKEAKMRYDKIELDLTLLRPYFVAGPAKRQEVSLYCLRDSEITYLMALSKQLFLNYYQMANITYSSNAQLVTGGASKRISNLMWSKMIAHKWAINFDDLQRLRNRYPVIYEGALVLEAKEGFYQQPVCTLDFESLYPSIIQAFRLCYSTLIWSEEDVERAQKLGKKVVEHDLRSHFRAKLLEYERLVRQGVKFAKKDQLKYTMEDVERMPNPWFVETERNLLPNALTDLLSARKKAKQDKEAATEQYVMDACEAKQLALKLVANAAYGMTGGGKLLLSLMPIAAVVTFRGRGLLDFTCKLVEEDGDIVLYGDTDSCMFLPKESLGIDWSRLTPEEEKKKLEWLLKLCAQKGARHTKTINRAPIKLSLDKLQSVFALYGKKTYAAIVWEKNKAGILESKLVMKGLSCKKRDWCPISRKLGESIVTSIMDRRDATYCLDLFRKTLTHMVSPSLRYKELSVSKKLKKEYKNASTMLIQQHVAAKIAKRDPARAPQPGDRISYIVTAGNDLDYATRGEEVEYAEKNALPIDYSYYVSKQMIRPSAKLLMFSVRDAEDQLVQIAEEFAPQLCGTRSFQDYASLLPPGCPPPQPPVVSSPRKRYRFGV